MRALIKGRLMRSKAGSVRTLEVLGEYMYCPLQAIRAYICLPERTLACLYEPGKMVDG